MKKDTWPFMMRAKQIETGCLKYRVARSVSHQRENVNGF